MEAAGAEAKRVQHRLRGTAHLASSATFTFRCSAHLPDTAMPGHRITKGLAWLSALASLLVAAVELVRVIQLLYRIDQRYRAWYGGYETIYDSQYSTCAYFVSGTDQPLHVGAVAFAPLWHCFNIVFLILIFLAEIPVRTLPRAAGIMAKRACRAQRASWQSWDSGARCAPCSICCRY